MYLPSGRHHPTIGQADCERRVRMTYVNPLAFRRYTPEDSCEEYTMRRLRKLMFRLRYRTPATRLAASMRLANRPRILIVKRKGQRDFR